MSAEKTPQARPVEADQEEDETYFLSEKYPFFEMVFSKAHVNHPWSLKIPKYAHSMLPSEEVPVVLRHGGKEWTVMYIGLLSPASRPRFDSKWRNFVVDNKLKIGDACVFEVVDPGPEKPVLKVFILRGDLPPELEALVDTSGGTSESPIVMD